MRRISVAPTVGKAPPRRLPCAVAVEHLRPGCAGARMRLEELPQHGDGTRLRHRIRIRDQHELVLGVVRAEVRVRREGARDVVDEHARPVRQLRRQAARDVRDHEQLVDLRGERRQRLRELAGMPMGDDNGADFHDRTSR